MRSKMVKSSREQSFLLVTMATLLATSMAVKMKVENQNQNGTENSTKVGISVNETGGNLTLDFNSGDLAFEREKSKHELIVTNYPGPYYSSSTFVECRGENIKSLSAISCDTMESCEDQKSLLFDQTKCGWEWNVQCGRKCPNYWYGPSYSDGHYAEDSTSSCLRIEMPTYSRSCGIVQCTSEENGLNVTSFDHYTIDYSNPTLLSSFKNKSGSDLIKIELFVSSFTEDLNANSSSSQSDQTYSVTLFEDEEVTLLVCRVPRFLFHVEGLIIRAHRKDGSTVELESKTTPAFFGGFMKADLNYYRASKDLLAFSCSAQKTNSSGEWLENRIHVTVQDLPSQVIVKTKESRNMSVNLTSGAKVNLDCQVTGSLHIQTSVENQMRKMRGNFLSEPSSNSVIEFLRFYQVAGENLNCKELGKESANSDTLTARHKHYGYKQAFHFIFHLAPSAPKIHNPNPNNSSSSSVDLIYHKDLLVDQTMLCLFKGDPKPVVTWIKNGHNLLSAKSLGIREQGNETFEHVKLGLNSTTIQPTDFKNGNGSAHVNFSCVANNYFGSDRLDFIIMMAGKFDHHAKNFESTTTTGKSTTLTAENSVDLPSSTTTISTSTSQSTKGEDENSESNLDQLGAAEKSKLIATVTTFFLLSFIFILGVSILWKKRAAVCRAVESRRIFTFRNLIQSDGNRSESTRNVLAD